MRVSFFAFVVIVLGVLSPNVAQPMGADESLVVVRAGDGEEGYAVNAYLPKSITVATGSTVRWTFPWYEPHSITFGEASSGAQPDTPSGSDFDGTGFHSSQLLFGPGPEYEIRFTKAGTYDFYCVKHPYQEGSVTVVDDAELAESQADIDARAESEYQSAVGELKSIAATWAGTTVAPRPLPDGSTNHVVLIAGETHQGDVQQFFPQDIAITQGDTVTWDSRTYTGHTVTFGPFPSGLPLPGNPLVDGVFRPAESYDGTGYWNSGVLGFDFPQQEFAMKFTTPGTFYYYCTPHVSQGMYGEIVVAPSSPGTPAPTSTQVAPLPPDTGSGSGPPAEGPRSLVAGALAAALAALALVFVARGRRPGNQA